MKNKLFIFSIVTILTFGSIGIAFAAPSWNYQKTILPETDNAFDIGTTTGNANSGVWRNAYITQLCLSADCKSAWPTGGGSDPFTHPAVGQSATTSLMLFNGNATSSQLSTGTTWFTGITGVAGNCLHVDTNGKVSGMGADCGTAGGEANTGGSLGTGLNLYDSKSGVQLLFNTLAAGTNITLSTTTNSNTIVINATGGGSGTVSTSTNETAGSLSYWTSNSATPALLGKVATTSATCSGSTSCSAFTVIGSSPITISSTGVGSGLATTSPVSGGNVLTYSAIGAGSAYGTATSTLTASGPLTGSFTQIGSGGSLGCTTASAGVAGCLNSSDWSTFNNKQNALTVTWPQILTGSALTFGGLSTSTSAVIGNIPYFSGVNTFANIATTTLSSGTGITISGGNGYLIGGSNSTVGLASMSAGVLGTSVAGVPSSQATSTLYGGSSTGGFVLGWSNALNGLTLMATSSAGGGTFPFTPTTNYGTNVNATTTPIWFNNGMMASTTSYFTNATTTLFTSTGSTYLSTTGSSVGVATTSPFARFSIDTSNLATVGLPEFAIGSSTRQDLIVTQSGNVGIGTTSPSAKLNVYTTGAANLATFEGLCSGCSAGGITLSNNATIGSNSESLINFKVGGNTRSQITGFATSAEGGFMRFNSLNTPGSMIERMRITGSGRVGIGTTTPFAILSVSTTTASSDPNLSMFSIASSTNATLFNVLGSGKVGIGTTSPWRTFAVKGTVGMEGLTTSAGLQTGVLCISATNEVINDSVACLSSSRRFKKDITSLSNTLSEVMKLNPVSFKYTDAFNGSFKDNPNYNGEQVGFIAEDVQKIDPRLVVLETEGKDKGLPHSVRYENMTALLAGAVQEIERQVQSILGRVTGLEDKINAQQAQIDSLQNQINQLKQ